MGGDTLNVNKPLGLSSFGVVKRIRRWTGYKKVGHAGTLDPSATGVLIVCTGRSTKQISRYMDMVKEYQGLIELGKRTTTDDGEGEVIECKPIPELSSDDVLSALFQFVGKIKQIPPQYSAIKWKGQRSYRLARRGHYIPLRARWVDIYDIQMIDWESPFLRFQVACSKGTYIRALARDIGNCLGTGAYLKALVRTRVGPFTIGKSQSLDQIKTFYENDASLSRY
ncbi:tRNA pseudouridine(55) synthase TruB [bacterium]|nr:tRNA pseudouridine(55) synthase TruB [bacterium]